MGEGATTTDGADAARVFDDHRGLLLGVACRGLGGVANAENAVQDARRRRGRARSAALADPHAFPVAVATRPALVLAVADGAVQTIYLLANPAKLAGRRTPCWRARARS